METLSDEIKKFLSLYSKMNTNENSMEISVGNSLGKYIFDTNVSNKYWKGIQKRIESANDYTIKKEFTYDIYTDYDTKLYKSPKKTNCISSKLIAQSLCYNNSSGFDFKISIYKKKPENTATFPPKYDYHNMVTRKTISYNFNNGFYLNLSEIDPINKSDTTKRWSIDILLSKNSKITRNLLIKNIMKVLRDIYSVLHMKVDEFRVHSTITD